MQLYDAAKWLLAKRRRRSRRDELVRTRSSDPFLDRVPRPVFIDADVGTTTGGRSNATASVLGRKRQRCAAGASSGTDTGAAGDGAVAVAAAGRRAAGCGDGAGRRAAGAGVAVGAGAGAGADAVILASGAGFASSAIMRRLSSACLSPARAQTLPSWAGRGHATPRRRTRIRRTRCRALPGLCRVPGRNPGPELAFHFPTWQFQFGTPRSGPQVPSGTSLLPLAIP